MEKHLTVFPILAIIGAKKRQPLDPPRFLGLPLEVFRMDIITENTKLLKSFWLYFHILGNGTEWIDYNLPTPTLHKHINSGYCVGWAIDGFFGTKEGREFLNDIIARFLITFKDNNIKRLPFKPKQKDLEDKTARIYAKVYKLREFSKQLKSLKTKKHIPRRAEMYADFTFWAIKLYAEDMIRENGIIVYSQLEEWALNQFIDKERSTIRAKCRSIYNWYEQRDFNITSKKTHRTLKVYLEETMASRAEHMKNVAKQKAEKNRRAVINILTGLYAEDYKKKSGAWHFTKIAKATGLSSKTVSKIIKELMAEGKIK